MLPWTKLPTMWLRPVATPGVGGIEQEVYPLAELQWARYKGSAIAVILVLMVLAIRLNLSQKGKVFQPDEARPSAVGATFEDIREMTRLAKPTISRAIDLLKAFGVIDINRSGRANTYSLIGIDQDGGWCQLPQGWLLDRSGNLKLKGLPRNRHVLNALKVYLILMHLRDRKTNTAAVSYTAITRWSGVRREDIPTALGTLNSLQMARPSLDRDIRHQLGDNSHRYSVIGLGNAFPTDQDLVTTELSRDGRTSTLFSPVMVITSH